MPNGLSRGYRYFWRSPFSAPSGYKYLGPCRCGCGPHAFYRTPEGYVSRAPAQALPELKPEEEAKWLEEEAKALQEELRRVEERLKKIKE
jgi:hypothetical protein